MLYSAFITFFPLHSLPDRCLQKKKEKKTENHETALFIYLSFVSRTGAHEAVKSAEYFAQSVMLNMIMSHVYDLVCLVFLRDVPRIRPMPFCKKRKKEKGKEKISVPQNN